MSKDKRDQNPIFNIFKDNPKTYNYHYESNTFVHGGAWDSFLVDSDPDPANELIISPKHAPSTPEILTTNRNKNLRENFNSTDKFQNVLEGMDTQYRDKYMNKKALKKHVSGRNNKTEYSSEGNSHK